MAQIVWLNEAPGPLDRIGAYTVGFDPAAADGIAGAAGAAGDSRADLPERTPERALRISGGGRDGMTAPPDLLRGRVEADRVRHRARDRKR